MVSLHLEMTAVLWGSRLWVGRVRRKLGGQLGMNRSSLGKRGECSRMKNGQV
jgi:hypothetical protein